MRIKTYTIEELKNKSDKFIEEYYRKIENHNYLIENGFKKGTKIRGDL